MNFRIDIYYPTRGLPCLTTFACTPYLSTFPASYSTQWNTLSEVQWSSDRKYVLYQPVAEEYGIVQSTYVASMDGIVQIVDGYSYNWLSNTKIIANTINGTTFDIEKEEEGSFMASGFKKLGVLRLTQDFIILDSPSKDRIEAALYPEKFTNSALWSYDALMKNKVVLITFSPEIKKPEILLVNSITELPNHQLLIEGYGNFEIGDNAYTYFMVIVDKENIPSVVKEQNLYGRLEENGLPNESPAAFSPDGKLVLLANVVLHDDNTFPHIKLPLQDMEGKELRVDEKLSQFNGITRIVVLPEKGIAFYWQP